MPGTSDEITESTPSSSDPSHEMGLFSSAISAVADAPIAADDSAGGALDAQVELRTLEQKEAVADYARVGLGAFGEVENSLASERAARDRIDILAAQLASSERALELENTRYRVGSTDLRSVNQQRLAVYAARMSLLRVRTEQLDQRVSLHLALGGSFDTEPG